MSLTKSIIIIFVLFNIFSFSIYGIDKKMAIKNYWRIPEKELIFLSFIAPFGALIGMKIFRHKTQKSKFQFTIPLFVFIQIICAILYIIKN